GRKLLPPEVDRGAVGQALAFLTEVNRRRHLPAAQALPVASEAYFTLAGHFECVERRLRVLGEINPSAEVDCEAAPLAQDQLAPAWRAVCGRVQGRALGIGPEAELPPADRRLSPSDFGFHNALRTESGRLRFLDFEYAGWDDLAKTVADFFCQVAV